MGRRKASLKELFIKKISETKSVFDLVAECYGFIDQHAMSFS